jgi:glycosyltransferase involved in cell wall biosynthesis
MYFMSVVKNQTTKDDLDYLSVIIPVYNEVFRLTQEMWRVLAVQIPKELIIIDDCSRDGTRELLEQWAANPALLLADYENTSLKILFHEKNQGKGAAIRTGVAHATGRITLIQDADQEYDPAEYPKLLALILMGDSDVVYGSRFCGESRRVLSFWHSLGNKLLTLLSNMCTNLSLTDMETCYKVFKTEIIKNIPLRSNRFGFEREITAKIAKLRCNIYEVPITYKGRSYAEGKKINWKDGISAIYTILKFRFVDDYR